MAEIKGPFRAEILSIGTELLIGQVVNTNATFLARELARLGVDLYGVTTVGDNMERLVDALKQAWTRTNLVICTGGLGPTADDITIEAIGRLLDEPLEERPAARVHLDAYYALRQRIPNQMDFDMARFPASADLIPNPSGSALGLYVQKGDKAIMTFPGVPHEMEAMWRSWAAPWLEAASGATIRSRLLKFVGAPEAEVAAMVADFLEGQNPSVAPYTSSGEVHLRVTAKAPTAAEADRLIAPVEAAIRERLQGLWFGSDEDSLPGVVGRLLLARNETVATAESATGGLLASRITDVAGSSAYFLGGVVAYTIPQKVALLGVDPAHVAKHGHVSAETTVALAQRVREVVKTTWGLGVTGYAGPGPGTPDDRVGTMFVAVSGPDGFVRVREDRFGTHPRSQVKFFGTQRALALLLRELT